MNTLEKYISGITINRSLYHEMKDNLIAIIFKNDFDKYLIVYIKHKINGMIDSQYFEYKNYMMPKPFDWEKKDWPNIFENIETWKIAEDVKKYIEIWKLK